MRSAAPFQSTWAIDTYHSLHLQGLVHILLWYYISVAALSRGSCVWDQKKLMGLCLVWTMFCKPTKVYFETASRCQPQCMQINKLTSWQANLLRANDILCLLKQLQTLWCFAIIGSCQLSVDSKRHTQMPAQARSQAFRLFMWSLNDWEHDQCKLSLLCLKGSDKCTYLYRPSPGS